MGKAERQERRRNAVRKVKAFVIGRTQHALRAPDEEDIEAAQALGIALITFAPGGYSKEEWAAIEDLWASLREERADTPG